MSKEAEREEAAALLRDAERRIRVAANAFVVRDGQALLVEFSGGTEREHYNFPGGGVEVGETLVEGVRREVREETCIEVDVERVLLVVESVGSRNTNEIGGVQVPWNEVRFFFLCTPVDGSEARLPDGPDEKQTGVRWLPLSELPSVNVLPQVGEHLIAALETGAPFLVVPNPHP